jgi:hypothetical protein
MRTRLKTVQTKITSPDEDPLKVLCDAAWNSCIAQGGYPRAAIDWLIQWASSTQTPPPPLAIAALRPIMFGAEDEVFLLREQHMLRRQIALLLGIMEPVHLPPGSTKGQAKLVFSCVDELRSLTPERQQTYAVYVLLSMLDQGMRGDTAAAERMNEILLYAIRVEGRKTPPSAARIRELFGPYIRTEMDVERLRRDWSLYNFLAKDLKGFFASPATYSSIDFTQGISAAASNLIMAGRSEAADRAEANPLWGKVMDPITASAACMARSGGQEMRREAAQAALDSLLERDINYRTLQAPTLLSLRAYIVEAAKSRVRDHYAASAFNHEFSPRHSRRLLAEGSKNLNELTIAANTSSSAAHINPNDYMAFNDMFEQISKRLKITKKQLRAQIDELCEAGEVKELTDGSSKKLHLDDVGRVYKRLAAKATPR